MKYTTFSGTGYEGGGIIKEDSKIMFCIFTIDLHTKHSLKQTALEHIYTDALLSGAGEYSREEFIDAINLLGASISVSLTNSKLTISLKSLKSNSAKVFKLFETMMLRPTFAQKEIKRIQTQVANELIEYKENARGIANDHFVNSLYIKEDRRCAESPENISKELKSITQTDLKTFHSAVKANSWTFTSGGSETVIHATENSVKKIVNPSSNSTKSSSHSYKKVEAAVLLSNVPSKQNIEFSIGTYLPLTLHHPDYLPFVFGLSVLGKWGGFTGRLMSTVREKEGLTYTIYARPETVSGDEQGHWRIMTFFAPDKSVQGLKSTLREITNIHKNGITKNEFDRFKVILKTQQTLLADSFIQSVQELHGYITAGFSIKEMDSYKARLLTVTQKEVNSALKKYLSPNQLVISGAGPIKDVKKSINAIKMK